MTGRSATLAAVLVAWTTTAAAATPRPKATPPPPPQSPIVRKLAVPAREAKVFGQRIVYYEAGQGRTLVLLASLGWDSHIWAQNLPELARSRRVIAIDMLGTGGSAKPLIDYKLDTWTDVVAELLRQKGIATAAIAGAVTGGTVAVQFALDHPEMTEAIVVAASNAGPGKHEGGKSPAPWPSLAGTRRALLLAFHDDALVTDEVVRMRFEQRLRADDAYVVQRYLADHRAPYSTEELSRIRVPALFVWCREDPITPPSWGEDFAAAVRGARLALLDRCGHFPNIERPTEFDAAVDAFLRGVQPGDPPAVR